MLSLGSNLGDRITHLQKACEKINKEIGEITSISAIYDTPPMGFNAPQSFLNICLSCLTPYSPEKCLEKIHNIEAEMGRIRVDGSYTSRTIDIDIIFFNSLIKSDESPLIPHPSYHVRKFVLIPLNDLDPLFRDPRDQRTVNQILSACPDHSEIHKFKKKSFRFNINF